MIDGGGIWWSREDMLTHFDETKHVRGFWNTTETLWCCQECIEITSGVTSGWID